MGYIPTGWYPTKVMLAYNRLITLSAKGIRARRPNIDDQVGVYLDAIDRYDGILNATAPAPVRNKDFTRALAAAMHRPAFLPVPAFALQLLFGEGADVVTKGQRVLPEATLASGYVFTYPEIDGAMRALVG